ncbi:cuticle protein 10.9-like [Centruroides vittatus]|uniref:cuticle protein 10.9-like n=1 Tax=Centruroides vittatus TaxID=120091 RepID=UPI00350EBE41
MFWICLILATVICASARSPYGDTYQPAAATNVGGGYRPPQPGRFRPDENYPPQPYQFNYNIDDGFGNQQYRQETGDQNGAVKGTYGYYDANGVYRNVDYIADSYGFRATIRTNEPGVGADNPADVSIDAQPPPAGLQERYTKPGGGYVPPPSSHRRPPSGGIRRPAY